MEKFDIEKAREYINKLNPPVPMVTFEPKRSGGITVFDSKMGGVPYFPKDMEYPRGKSGSYEGRPLRFLAQLNFEKLPHIEDFPKKGILQFFCSDDEDESVYGLDFDDPVSQNGFRVVYHENIITDESRLISEADISGYGFNKNDRDFPFKGEFLLVPHDPEMCPPLLSDHRVDNALMKYMGDTMGETLHGIDDIVKSVHKDEYFLMYDEFADEEVNECTCIGGYPFFTQEDPRSYSEKISGYDILLFQSASHYWNDPDKEIMWGDAGVANFFIKRDDLINLDFSKTAYNWDCC